MNVLDFRPVGASEPETLPEPSAPAFAAPGGYSSLPGPGLVGPGSPKSDGPELPPMDPRLANTPIERIRTMFVYVIVRGLTDGDTPWVNDPAFFQCCEYAGLEGATPQRIRDLYNAGGLDVQRLRYCLVGLNTPEERAVA